MVLGPPSPRHQFWAKRLVARYVTAVSQRKGMWRTLCSRLTSGRTCWGPGAVGLTSPCGCTAATCALIRAASLELEPVVPAGPAPRVASLYSIPKWCRQLKSPYESPGSHPLPSILALLLYKTSSGPEEVIWGLCNMLTQRLVWEKEAGMKPSLALSPI